MKMDIRSVERKQRKFPLDLLSLKRILLNLLQGGVPGEKATGFCLVSSFERN
jgi:hypothetical protein